MASESPPASRAPAAASAGKSASKKAADSEVPAKKVPAKKATAKKATAKKATAKKATAKKVPAKKTASRPATASPASVEFGKRVRTRRTELGLTLEDLEALVSIHWSYLGQLERGKPNPTLHTLLRIAEALGVEPASLVEGLKAPPH